MATRRVLVVLGGTGFVGRHICAQAVRGAQFDAVYSVSRRGIPPATAATTSWEHHPCMHWVGQPSEGTLEALLENAYREKAGTALSVVCSVGALFENEAYKQFLEEPQNVSPFAGRGSSQTYEFLNRDVCIRAVQSVRSFAEKESTVSSIPFVFISAHASPPGVDEKYVETKREAERYLLDQAHENSWSGPSKLRPIIFRPSFIYDESRPASMHIATGLKLGHVGKTFLSAYFPAPERLPSLPFGGALEAIGHSIDECLSAPPVRVTRVADAAVSAILDEGVSGTFGPNI